MVGGRLENLVIKSTQPKLELIIEFYIPLVRTGLKNI